MKRISKELKAIADRHIDAKAASEFLPQKHNGTVRDVYAKMDNGATYSGLLELIEIKFCSVHSLIASSVLDYQSDSYRKGVYKGFKNLFGEISESYHSKR